MPTENKAAPFHREDRYNVIKYTDLERLPHAERWAVNGFLRRIHESVLKAGAPARQSVVIESDWPEYEPAWQMIERRMAGQPPVTAAEELDAVLHWRTKHSQAIKERDALQQRLTAADERADTATSLIQRIVANFDTEIEYHEDVEPNDLEHDQVLTEMREFLSPGDADWRMNPCRNGHRDVGAAGGVAHCYTCDEKLTAANTQEAFEQWNATHPAT